MRTSRPPLQEIRQAQALIKQETWGSGNILAGLGSFGPQAALATAQLLLGIWSSTIAGRAEPGGQHGR